VENVVLAKNILLGNNLAFPTLTWILLAFAPTSE